MEDVRSRSYMHALDSLVAATDEHAFRRARLKVARERRRLERTFRRPHAAVPHLRPFVQRIVSRSPRRRRRVIAPRRAGAGRGGGTDDGGDGGELLSYRELGPDGWFWWNAELDVLGFIFRLPSAVGELERLTSRDFSRPATAHIWSAMIDLHRRGTAISVGGVRQWLVSRGISSGLRSKCDRRPVLDAIFDRVILRVTRSRVQGRVEDVLRLARTGDRS